MPHFATTALFRKRTAEKRNEKNHGKTSRIHAKSDENSWRFRKSMADCIFHAFCSILAQFFCKKRALGPPRATLGGSRAVPWASAGALGRLPGRSGRPFWVKKWFLENVHAVEAPTVIFGIWGALWPLRAPPAPFGTCHDAFGTRFWARKECKKPINFMKCEAFSNFLLRNAGFHEGTFCRRHISRIHSFTEVKQ